jgi:hypothetical protein
MDFNEIFFFKVSVSDQPDPGAEARKQVYDIIDVIA